MRLLCAVVAPCAFALVPTALTGARRASSHSAASRSVVTPRMSTVPYIGLSEKEDLLMGTPPSGDWSPSSWRNMEVAQMPNYPDKAALKAAEEELAKCAPLVFAGECRSLHEALAQATLGRGFLLMGGDCAESFEEFSVDHIRDSFRVILQMALVLTYGGALPVIKVGRMAGQFAKPRSADLEEIDGVSLPSYRGDNINGEAFTSEARVPDPARMVKGYHQSAQTANLLRAFATGGYADIGRLHAWNLDFVASSAPGSKYAMLADKVDEAMRFVRAMGVDTTARTFTQTEFFTAHEALLLPYEEALTRRDSTTGRWYSTSAHMLWIGERTRQLDGAHLEFCRGIGNPVGIKVSDKCEPAELIEMLQMVNPHNVPGRVTLIMRMGAGKMPKGLPPLVRAVQKAGAAVLWIVDPVHGNTIKTESGYKTRPFNLIMQEIMEFFDVLQECGAHPGGVHLEMTGEDVTECIGGEVGSVTEADLRLRYKTQCDPRLNGKQALEIAFEIAQRLRSNAGLDPLECGV